MKRGAPAPEPAAGAVGGAAGAPPKRLQLSIPLMQDLLPEVSRGVRGSCGGGRIWCSNLSGRLVYLYPGTCCVCRPP